MNLNFMLDQKQQVELDAWLKTQYARVVELQKGTEFEQHHFESNGIVYPYFGAIGGEITYEFTPTGLGNVLIAHFCKSTPIYAASINLTDYDSW